MLRKKTLFQNIQTVETTKSNKIALIFNRVSNVLPNECQVDIRDEAAIRWFLDCALPGGVRHIFHEPEGGVRHIFHVPEGGVNTFLHIHK